MFPTICVLIVIASILLVLVVLIQNSKGGGLAANFATGNQTFGVRQTADYLEKATWGLAIAVMVLCVAATTVMPKGGAAGGSAVQQQLQNTQGTSAPQFPTNNAQPQQQQPAQEQPAQPQQPAEQPTN